MVIVAFMIWISLVVHFAGYVMVLRWWKRPRNFFQPLRLESVPMIHVIVPTFNEAELIESKIRNLASLTYPRARMKVVIIDGGSTDHTEEIARQCSRHCDWIEVRKSNRPGKINQLNEVLETIPEEDLICVTDADAIIRTPMALEIGVDILRTEGAGVVGGWTMPGENPGSPVSEKGFWDKQNRMRHLESEWFSSSIVVAPFYLFQRSLVDSFPVDCVADDVYIAFQAHLKSQRVIYTPKIDIEELRQPQSRRQLILHKFRKANAYSIELFRALHRLPWMCAQIKFLYGMKLFQFFYLPLSLVGYLLIHVYWATQGKIQLLAIMNLALFILTLMASLMMKPPQGRTRGGLGILHLWNSLEVMAVTTGVLIANFFLFPFWTQDSRYRKVSNVKAPSESVEVPV